MSDIISKGKKAGEIAQVLYGAYKTGSQVYRVVRPLLQGIALEKKDAEEEARTHSTGAGAQALSEPARRPGAQASHKPLWSASRL